MKNSFLLFLGCLVFLAFSCEDKNPPTPYVYESNPKYAWGFQTFYGSYYQKYNQTNNVISLSLFTDSIGFYEDGTLGGFGQYLFLEDIFVSPSDSILAEGIYVISDTAEPFTLLPGKLDSIGDEVFPVGPRITYYEKDPTKSIGKLITSGTFTVSLDISSQDTVYSIACNFITSDKLALKGTFTAPLIHLTDTISPSNTPRLSHFKTKKIVFK